MKKIQDKLRILSDEEYRIFTSKTIPNIDIGRILGVRVPDIRKLAKEIKDEVYIEEFLDELPHYYQEENLLHGLMLSTKYKDIDTLLAKIDIFLDYADNWIVTDIMSPKLFKKYPDKAYEYILKWISSGQEYKIRFGVVSLLQFYLDDNYDKKILTVVKKIKSDDYYVKMAIAWFYSFALIKQYDDTIKIFEKKELDKWVHNKSITKATESYRISDEVKDYLRSLKIR